MLHGLNTITVTNGTIKHVVVTCNNYVSNELLQALFKTNIVGLQCIDVKSNTEVFK